MDPSEDWSGNAPVSSQNDGSPENEGERVNQVIPGYDNFDDYIQEAYDTVRAGIKAANSLPSGENYNYYTCFPSFVNAKDQEMGRLLNIMQNLLGVAGVGGSMRKGDAEDKFDLLLEANDVYLDRANACMDEECGIAKNTELELVVTQTRRPDVNGSWNAQPVRKPEASDAVQSVRLLAGKNIHRPQLCFKDKIDNSAKPWCPRIKDKPNSLKPLAIYLEESESGEVFNHPYEFELDKFVPPEGQLKKREPIKYKPLAETPLIMIENPSDIDILLEDLRNYSEIAIDLEHHSYRSFQGITCLMQISTADTDYLIDTLTLRSELHQLNEIFTKPTVLKVFHGADLDVQWLQRDLSLYVVNMFDTHQAAKQLNLPYLSLAYLLKQYCNIDPNKHFQLADWRIRPLPEELQKYAREDTHYSLYIKDILSNTLIDAANGQSNIVKAVYDRSTEICKKMYIKPIWTEDSYVSMYRKSQKMFNNKQMYALKELHKWRDLTARAEDDSTAYVLPNHMLLNIAETLPREMQGILACCNPIPPLVRQNLLKLHKVILKAREQPLMKPILQDDLRQRLAQRNQIAHLETWMYSPHDIPSGTEARADLPCLLDNDNSQESLLVDDMVEHTITVFDSPPQSEDEETIKSERLKAKKKFLFVSPFERYKRVIPMIAEQEARDREKERKEEEERLNRIKEEEGETIESKARVYEHFKKVSQLPNDEASPEQRKKLGKVPLGQMHGRKRKRDSAVQSTKEPREKSEDDLSTPVPSLNARISQGVKKLKREEDESFEEERKIKENLGRMRKERKDGEAIRPIRVRAKGEKKANEVELTKLGMMPAKKFDYNSIDFSSFQGGSKNVPHQVKFNPVQNTKRKDKPRKRKKQKLNI